MLLCGCAGAAAAWGTRGDRHRNKPGPICQHVTAVIFQGLSCVHYFCVCSWYRHGSSPTGQGSAGGYPERHFPGPHTQETGHSGVGGVCGVQIHLVGVEPRRRDGQVAAQPVNVLHKCHVHLQGPLP